MNISVIVCCLVFTFATTLNAQKLSLKEAEQLAISNSSKLRAVKADLEAAQSLVKAQSSARYPRIDLDTSYKYVSELTEMEIMGNSMELNKHHNYSIGPMISYPLFDGGKISSNIDSAKALSDAREKDLVNESMQLKLKTRTAYFRVQLALEEVQLTEDSLKLTKAQYNDIINRVKAGALSQLDKLTGHKEVIHYELKVKQAQAELQTNIAELLNVISSDDKLYNSFEPQENSLKYFASITLKEPDDMHPQIKSMQLMSDSIKYSAESIAAQHLPQVNLAFKSSLDYPNGPKDENIFQNSLMLSLKMPLVEWGLTSDLSKQKKAEALSVKHKKDQLKKDLSLVWNTLYKQLNSYKEQLPINKEAIETSEKVSKLVYTSYKEGRSNILDVQAANLRALESNVNEARLNTQILILSATLAALSGKE